MENINIFSETFKQIISEEVKSVQLDAREKDEGKIITFFSCLSTNQKFKQFYFIY